MRTAPDRCPGALRVHEAADGGLVRIRVPGGLLTAAQVRALADATTALGDGNLDLTSRGNVQLRGLRDRDALLDVLLDAGLLPSPAHDTARNVVASVLADLPVRELDAALCADAALAGLPGRFLLGLDDGSGDVQALAPDLSLQGSDLVIGGRLAGPGRVPDLLHACRAFLALRTAEWRLAELPDGAERVAGALGRALGAPAVTGAAVPVGAHGDRVVAHVRFGRLTPAHLAVLGAVDGHVVLTPWHSVVVPAGTDTSLFVTDPASPWVGVTACVGIQCARALADVRADAAPGSVPTHWSGCARRCGKPAGSRDLVATENGYEVFA